jgi:hypothetical protein
MHEATPPAVRIAPLPIHRERPPALAPWERPTRYWGSDQLEFVQFALQGEPSRPIELPEKQFECPAQMVEPPKIRMQCPPPFEPFEPFGPFGPFEPFEPFEPLEPFEKEVRRPVREASPPPVSRDVPEFTDGNEVIANKKNPADPPMSISFVLPQWKEGLFHCGNPADMRRKLTRMAYHQKRNV